MSVKNKIATRLSRGFRRILVNIGLYSKSKFFTDEFNIRDFNGSSNLEVAGSYTLNKPKGVKLGDNVKIGRNCSFDSLGGILVGDNVQIGNNVKIESTEFCDNSLLAKNVVIASNISIDHGAFIKAGTKIKTEETELFKPEKVVFILSSGRSGSRALIDSVMSYQGIQALHEPNLYLTYLSALLMTNAISENEAEQNLREYYTTALSPQNKTYIESDQKLIYFVPLLKKIFPNAQFLWIYREPRSFIKSAASRQWFKFDKVNSYKGHMVINIKDRSLGTRLGAFDLGEMSMDEWKKLSIVERNAWYWTHVNTLCYSIKSTENMISVELSKLSSASDDVATFLGIPKNCLNIMKTNKTRNRDIHRKRLLSESKVNEAASQYCDALFTRIQRS